MVKKPVPIAVAVLLFAGTAAAQSPLAKYGATTLQPGFEITGAFLNYNKRDGESFTKVLGADAIRYNMGYSNSLGTIARRNVLRGDRKTARVYVVGFSKAMPSVLTGTTSVGLSSAVFRELKATGRAGWGLMVDTSGKTLPGEISVVEQTNYRIVLNNKVTNVPMLHARGIFKYGKTNAIGDFFILDNVHNPLMLRYVIKLGGQNYRAARDNRPMTMNVVRIDTGLSQRAALEHTLRTLRRYELYGIHFNFASAALRPGVRQLMADLAITLKNNPRWRLSIQGHTDAIGGAQSNLVLSQRRALAIKNTLVRNHKINPTRLQVLGFGLTRPKATNETLQGRALNRRVELVRLDNVN
jgi:outer membrane protein OmpA-like peptidoglycan-associated protein